MLMARLPVTVSLGIFSMILSLAVAVPAGIIAAVKHNRWPDMVLTVVSVGAVAVPGFWLGMILILVFVVWFGWLPGPGGYVRFWDDPWQSFQLTVLPAVALGMASMGSMMRLTRSSMLEVLGRDYIRTARAKGLSTRTVTVRHALRNASIPLISALGFQAIGMFSGSVIIERVFAIPGSGSMAVDGIYSRDFPVVQGFVLIAATVVVLINLSVDLAYGVVDPRIRYGKQ
jgi:peptide/nickel transport system permease protein